MYKYYIEQLININTNILDNLYSNTKRDEKIIISKKGMYKIYKDKLYKYKLYINNSTIIYNFLEQYTLLLNQEHWKRVDILYNIPFIHHILSMNITEYIIHPKVKFIVEKRNGMINDYYFLSSENHDSFIIKQEIGSFLSQLK